MTKCKVCKEKESHEYSSMCQSCIDAGWEVDIKTMIALGEIEQRYIYKPKGRKNNDDT